jgi:cytochrome oxidase Cu insertion factor (SCO1/SenC/PrrC family)
MTRPVRTVSLVLLLVALSLAAPSIAADIDRLMQEFRVTPAGLKPAPAFSLTTLEGKTAGLADHRGRPLLLYFWATW